MGYTSRRGEIIMYIKSMEREGDYLEVTVLTVANDIDIDFVCIQEQLFLYKYQPFHRIKTTRTEVKALEYIQETEPISKQLIKEHVFESAVTCNLSDEYMTLTEVLQCITTL